MKLIELDEFYPLTNLSKLLVVNPPKKKKKKKKNCTKCKCDAWDFNHLFKHRIHVCRHCKHCKQTRTLFFSNLNIFQAIFPTLSRGSHCVHHQPLWQKKRKKKRSTAPGSCSHDKRVLISMNNHTTPKSWGTFGHAPPPPPSPRDFRPWFVYCTQVLCQNYLHSTLGTRIFCFLCQILLSSMFYACVFLHNMYSCVQM